MRIFDLFFVQYFRSMFLIVNFFVKLELFLFSDFLSKFIFKVFYHECHYLEFYLIISSYLKYQLNHNCLLLGLDKAIKLDY